MLRRTSGGTPPASPTDGTLVADVGRTTSSYVDSGVSAAATYSYAAFARSASGAFAKPAVAVVNTARWEAQALPFDTNGADGATLGHVYCAGPVECVAVGVALANGSAPIAAARSGAGWRTSVLDLPPGATNVSISDMSCVDVRHCTATGTFLDALAEFADPGRNARGYDLDCGCRVWIGRSGPADSDDVRDGRCLHARRRVHRAEQPSSVRDHSGRRPMVDHRSAIS